MFDQCLSTLAAAACPPPPCLPNGQTTSCKNTYAFNEVVMYECDVGFQPGVTDAQKMNTCQNDGTWQTLFPDICQ